MTREKSCGALVFRKDNVTGKIYLLIIRHKHGKFFSFPKGHVEKGETEIMTAEREVMEETSVRIHITSDFRCTVNYHPSYGISKEVVYFLAETEQTETHPREGEIELVRWVELEKVEDILTYENDKNVLRSAITEIHKKYAEAY